MNRPIVLLDVDGVLADFVTPWLRYTNFLLNTSFSKIDITQHSIEDSLSLTDEECLKIRKTINRMRMSRTMAVLPGATEAVDRLKEISDVYFLTASLTTSETWEYDRRAWLDENFGEGMGKKAMFVKHKHLVYGDIYIDDSVDNVVNWCKFNRKKNINVKATGIIWAQWYNAVEASSKNNFNIPATASWDYVFELVERSG